MREPSDTTIKVDLHNHTRGSFDCLSDPDALLATARARGIHRLALTDHNRLGVALEMHEKYPDEVIPGEEVKTREGFDLIGLFIQREIPKGARARDVCDAVREEGGILYLPHPYAPGKGGGGELAEEFAPLVDVVEVFNARLHPGRLNGPAAALAERHGKLEGAGSDAHTLREVGGAWVEVPPHQNTPDALLQALAQGRVVGRTAPLWIHVASSWAKLRKALPW
ncbi:MAG: PHP domain-containing protein [Gemmatimonadota bacterium]